MEAELKKVDCDPVCGFSVKSHDEKELVSIVRNHASRIHHQNVTEKEVREKIQAA